jgi:hypothetical protein
MKFKISLDTVRFTNHPTKTSTGKRKKDADRIAGAISNRLASPEARVELTLDEIADNAAMGLSWSPARFDENFRSNNGWVSQQLFGVDVDCNIDPLEAHDRAQELGLGFGFAYPSFSDTPEYRKFRYVMYTEKPITDFDTAAQIMRALSIVFNGFDQACKDPARLFFGGRGRLFLSAEKKPIDLDNLFLAAKLSLVNKSTNKSRRAKQVDEKLNLLNNRHAPEELPEVIEKVNIEEELVSQLKILQAVKVGHHLHGCLIYPVGERIHREEIKGLVWNLQYIKGGVAWLQKCMEEHGDYEDYHWDLVDNESAYKGYKPMQLKNFSPYPEDHHFHNILDITGRKVKKSGQVCNDVIEDPTFYDGLKIYTLAELDSMLPQTVRNIINSDDKRIHLIIVPPGSGKTKTIIEKVMRVVQRGYTFAYKTHANKNEVIRDMGVEYLNNFNVTPELPNSLPEQHKTKLAYYQSIAASNAYSGYLKSLIKRYRSIPERSELEQKILDELFAFQKDLRAAYGCRNRNIITTFKRVLMKKEGVFPFDHNSTLFFDEDPINELLSVNSVHLEDFNTLKGLVDDPLIKKLCQKYINILTDDDKITQIHQKEDFIFSSKQQEALLEALAVGASQGKFKTAIADFLLNADFYLSLAEDKNNEYINANVFHFLVKRELPIDRKIAIFSATASPFMYKALFGDRVVVHDLSNVLHKGNVKQKWISGGKNSILRNQALADVYTQEAGLRPTITFQGTKHIFENAIKDIHHGNSCGFNGFRGENICVAGVPHKPPYVIQLVAHALGHNLEPCDFLVTSKRICRNGYYFKLPTFEKPFLTEIQCFFIESELIQGIGRARTLREVCEVLVLGNYPIRHFWEGDESLKPYIIEYEPDQSNYSDLLVDQEVLLAF